MEIIRKFIDSKNKYLANPKIGEFSNQLKSMLGKSFQEDQIEHLIQSESQEFEKRIKEKFLQKRNERVQYVSETKAKEIEKRIFLQTIDLNWKSHIQYLEQLRQVIGLRSYGQRDPLIEYKKEAFILFENLLEKLKIDLVTILHNLTIVENSTENSKSTKRAVDIDPKYIGKKMSRNEPCLCGSGKKYKKCCGAL